MASLFGNLPAPTACETEEPAAKRPRGYIGSDASHSETAPPQTEADAPGLSDPAGKSSAPRVPPPPPGDATAAALLKISQHISQPGKLVKASRLLRQLLEQGTLDPASHGSLVYTALAASLADADAGLEIANALELTRLFTLASKQGQLFDGEQRSALEVLALRGVLRSHLLSTDDSFQFNRVVGKLKDAVAALPEEAEVEEGGEEQAGQAPQEEGQVAAPVQGTLPTAPPTGAALETLRRASLLDCLEAGRAVYRHAWARTSVDLFVDHFRRHVERFAPAERGRIAAMIIFVKDQRASRRQGPTAREASRDTTSFERASAAWSTASVSHRGKVGGGGDHKSENWLG